MKKKRTQAERKQQTQKLILDNAYDIFGEKGFLTTSVNDIALQAGVTEGAIYRYYENKTALFRAVTVRKEQELTNKIASINFDEQDASLLTIWELVCVECEDPKFCQIALIDSPHILGRERWVETTTAQQIFKDLKVSNIIGFEDASKDDIDLLMRMVTAALSEVALTIVKNPDYNSKVILEKFLMLFSK